MRLSAALRLMLRESRGSRGRLVYFAACLAVGVAAVVATAGFTAGVGSGVREKSREILGADIEFDARRPLPEALDALVAEMPGVERTDVLDTATMVSGTSRGGAPARSRLAQLVVVDGRYPLYGEIETTPEGGLGALLDVGSVVVAKELLDQLGLEPDEELRVGGIPFRVAGTIRSAPGEFGFSALLGPKIYLTSEGFAKTPLRAFGSRVRYRALLALPEDLPRGELGELARGMRARLPDAEYVDVETHYMAQPQGQRTMDRLDAFLGLAALLSLVIGGLGVAQIVRAWIAARTQAVAVMRCLGLRPREILALFLGHTLLLGLAGSLAGAAVGSALPPLVQAAFPDLLPGAELALPPASALLRGLALGMGMALLFSLPPLTAVWRVPPARVLRADAAPLPPNRIVSAAAALTLLGGIFTAAWIQSGSVRRAAWFTAGFAVLVLLLWLVARVVMSVVGRLPARHLHPYLRHGLGALARPGAGTTGGVVALGIGTMVVASSWLVERALVDELLSAVPESAPSVFLVDVQPEQWPRVATALEDAGARHVDHVPVVMARVASIGGRPVSELLDPEDRHRRRVLTREQRLTSRAELPESNEIVAGALWSDPARPEVSVEQRFAGELGVGVGDVIGFDVQGVPMELVVTSLRAVEWQSLSINFFLLVEPGVLADAPSFLLASARVDAAAEQPLQDRLTAEFPGVTMLRVRPILERVRELVARLVLGIRLLGTFTVVAGVAILAGGVAASALERGREVALLKTLGVTRAGVAVLLGTEYALAGAVAGFVGAGGALALHWAFLVHVADLGVEIPTVVLPIASAACALLAAVCGLAASLRALTVRPIAALR